MEVETLLGIFNEEGFMKLLAIAGYLLPYAILFGVYKLIRYAIAKVGDAAKRIADHLDHLEEQ